jgi:hypothetical protein
MRRAIEVGGWFNTGLPRIAVCRADATQCWVSVRGGGWGHGSGDSQVVYGATQFTDNRGALVGKNTVRVMAAGREGRDQWRGSTVVPLVPPRHRPKRHRLSRCHILWEVESWTPEPPVDPALIRHIRGDLWSVLAVWDLTELERMVLSQRSQ